MKLTEVNFAFFGSSEFSVMILEKLKSFGLVPKLVVTTEDKPKGRKLVLTPPEAKVWAIQNNVPYLQLKSLKTVEAEAEIRKYCPEYNVFVVASYGKMIPENILNIPIRKTLNIHPSLLPKLRGASPIKSAILSEDETGVTIIQLDKEMDHGPILKQKSVDLPEWPEYEENLEKVLAEESSTLLMEVLPGWIDEKIEAVEQDHSKATFCGKIEKSDAEINFEDSPEKNLRKIRAFHRWPGSFYFEDGKRIIIKKAKIIEGKLILERVLPEGKKEMNYSDYLRGRKN